MHGIKQITAVLQPFSAAAAFAVIQQNERQRKQCPRLHGIVVEQRGEGDADTADEAPLRRQQPHQRKGEHAQHARNIIIGVQQRGGKAGDPQRRGDAECQAAVAFDTQAQQP